MHGRLVEILDISIIGLSIARLAHMLSNNFLHTPQYDGQCVAGGGGFDCHLYVTTHSHRLPSSLMGFWWIWPTLILAVYSHHFDFSYSRSIGWITLYFHSDTKITIFAPYKWDWQKMTWAQVLHYTACLPNPTQLSISCCWAINKPMSSSQQTNAKLSTNQCQSINKAVSSFEKHRLWTRLW